MKEKRRKRKLSKFSKGMIALIAFVLSFSMLSQSVATIGDENAASDPTQETDTGDTTETGADQSEETSGVVTVTPSSAEAEEMVDPSKNTASQASGTETSEPSESPAVTETPNAVTTEPEKTEAPTPTPSETPTVSATPAPEEQTQTSASSFAKELKFQEDNNNVTVSISAEVGVLPEGTEVTLDRVVNTDPDYEKISDSINKEVDTQEVTSSVLYRITFKDRNQNEVKPDGLYTVRIDWDNAVRPEGTENSTVTVLETVKDESTGNYTAEDLVQNALENTQQQSQLHSKFASLNQNLEETVKDNDANNVHSLDIQSDASGVFAIAWTEPFTISVHYQDDSYKDLNGSDIVTIAQETDVQSLVKTFDDYSLIHAYMDTNEITGLKAEEGKLYFNNGTEWIEANNNDLYLIYQKNASDEDDTQQDQKDEEETEQQPEEEDDVAKEAESKTLTAESENYKVTVSYGKDAGLPEGTTLSVTEINEGDSAYDKALQQTADAKGTDDVDSFNMAAMDISLLDQNGNKAEPADNAKVNVTITFKNGLPADEDEISIYHIVPSANANAPSISANSLIRRAPSRVSTSNTQEAKEVDADIALNISGETSASFTVDQFSVFTITWTKGGEGTDKDTRIAQVNLHYVDEDGNELGQPTGSLSADELATINGGIVTLSTYANKGIANYTYENAKLSDAQEGTVVTGLMAKGTTTDDKITYSLMYTQETGTLTDTSTWTNVPVNAVTGVSTNSIDVFLIYHRNDHITVHYVDGTGEDLQSSEAKYLDTIDSEINLSANDTVGNSLIKEISSYTYNSAHLDSYLGDTFISLKKKDSGTGEANSQIQVKYKSDGDYEDTSATDLYLVYNRTDAKLVQVYYTDIAGIPITDKSGQPIVTTYDPSTWTNNTHDFTVDAEAYTPEGYAQFDKSNINAADDKPNWWSDGNPDHNDSNNTQNRILYVTDGYVSSTSSSFGVEILRNVRGYEFDTMTYNNNALSIKRSSSYGGSGSNAYAIPENNDNKSPYKVYLLYKPLVKIHDVDNNEKSLGNVRTGNWLVGYYAKNRWKGYDLDATQTNWNNTINSYSASQLPSNISFGNRTSIYVKYMDSNSNSTEQKVEVSNNADNTNNFKISWQFDGPQKWTTSNSSSAILQDTTEIRNQYHWVTRIYKNTDCTEYTDINGLVTDVYMVYDYTAPFTVTIHHIDESGNKVSEDTTKDITSGTVYTIYKDLLAQEQSNSFQYAPIKGYTDASLNNPFTTITYTKTGDTWTDNLNISGDSTVHQDLYIVYRPTRVVLHHVDENGHKIAADQTAYSITNNKNVYTDKWNGSSNVINSNHSASSSWTGGRAGTYKSETVYQTGGIWYKYDSGTGVWHTAIGTVDRKDATYGGYSKVTSTVSSAASNASGEINPDNPEFISDFYQVYSGVKGITVHHVDAEGNNLAADTYRTVPSASNSSIMTSDLTSSNVPSGYAFTAAYIDANKTEAITELDFDGNNWSYKTSAEDTTGTSLSDFNQEIYLVYQKGLTLHYIHSANSTSSVDENGNPVYELFTGLSEDKHPVRISYSDVAAANDEGLDLTAGNYAADISDTNTYKYYGTFLASPRSASDQLPSYARLTTDGPHVSRVRIHDGKYQFLVVSGDGQNRQLSQTRRDQWSYVTVGGRTYTLRKGSDGNFSMLDSQAGRSTYPLSLTRTESSTTDGKTTVTNYYTGTSGIEGTGIVYTIRETITDNGTPVYDVTVQEWIDINQRDIYQLYEINTGEPTVTISNEVVYSGNLVARTTNLTDDKIVSYEWQKSVNGGPYETVVRKQSGSEWNIDHDLRERSWLDLVADDGELSRVESRTSVKYKVILTYTDSGNQNKTIESQEFSVPYWDQLENGGFETPVVKDDDNTNPASKQYSNKDYKDKNGVWQTTGLGVNSSKSGKKDDDIEIVNTQRTASTDWKSTYGWPANNVAGGSDGAYEGVQFAELNCETAGALYQDVVTAPNEYLNYWLSHRARGSKSTARNSSQKAVYDTMYLVIMPTQLAMTSAADGGELKNQTDLQKFITDHVGSFSNSDPGKEEDEVVYRDTNSGILIEKISSSNQRWHPINNTNGYIATSNLTRFFFVAGHTATNDATTGNFLDAVGFSQRLQTPETPHYHMTVTKTFTGLSVSQIAQLKDTFKLTIDEYNTKNGVKKSSENSADYYEPDTSNSGEKHTSLNDAQLGFTINSNGDLELTATARDPNNPFSGNRINLLTNGSTGVVSEDPSTGAVTLTWTLYNNYFPNGQNDPEEKYFKITESGTDIAGYSVATSNNGTITDVTSTTVDGVTKETSTVTNLYSDSGNNATSSEGNTTDYITIKNRSIAVVNYLNSYRDNSNDDPDQIKVQKTFTGITPTVVSSLNGTANPFTITVKNSGGSSISLVGNVTTPVAGSYPAGVDHVDLETKANDDGSSTFTWTIVGDRDNNWVKGNNYSVKEEYYEPSGNDNPVTKITLNGTEASSDVSGKKEWSGETEGFKSVSVGNDNDIPNINNITMDGNVVSENGNEQSSEANQLADNTNLIIAKYTINEAARYLVWSPEPLGVNEKKFVEKVITQKFNDTTSLMVNWRSGKNPGAMEINSGEGAEGTKASMNYNSDLHTLQFTNSSSNTGAKWQSYYSTAYTLTGDDLAKTNEIRITNSYEPAVRVMKVSSGEISAPLQGAEFKLFTYVADSGTSTKMYFDSNKEFNANENDTTVVTFTTNDQGIAVSNLSDNDSLQIINGLKEGYYYLEETKAPAGYNMPVKPVVAIHIDGDGIVSQVTDLENLTGPNGAEKNRINTTKDGNGISINWNSPYYTITVRNDPGFILPKTGGYGIKLFFTAGILAIATAGVLMIKKKLNRKAGIHL